MTTVFFDLETSDRNFIGQIINYSFIAVDCHWQIVAELSGDIAISRLQLPAASAILANRCNVIKHQQQAEESEQCAMKKIHDFLSGLIKSSAKQVLLVGYNSIRFDLPFLRTCFIRNGIDPYFKGKLRYKDLLQAARALSCTDVNFPRQAAIDAEKKEADRLSLRLETLCSALKLLKGRQSHHSRADVLLTISLAAEFKEKFNLDIRKFDNYQPANITKKGSIVWESVPQYDLNNPEIAVRQPLLLLDNDHRSALWINLDKFEQGQGRKSISWFNKANSCLQADRGKQVEQELAQKALNEFKALNLRNFFTTSTCDIEQDIYRIDFDGINALQSAVWRDDYSALKSLKTRDVRVLLLRHELNSYQWGTGQNQRMEKILRDYALYRYGGRLLLSKFVDPDLPPDNAYHTTFCEQMAEIEQKLESCSRDDAVLLEALKKFYLDSDIYRLAGRQLKSKLQESADKAA